MTPRKSAASDVLDAWEHSVCSACRCSAWKEQSLDTSRPTSRAVWSLHDVPLYAPLMPRPSKHGEVLRHLANDVQILVRRDVPQVSELRREVAIHRATVIAESLRVIADELSLRDWDPSLVLVVERVRPAFLGIDVGTLRYARMAAIEAARYALSAGHLVYRTPEVTATSLVSSVAQISFANECPAYADMLTLEQWATLVEAWRIPRGRRKGRASPNGGRQRHSSSAEATKWVRIARILPREPGDTRPEKAIAKYIEDEWRRWSRLGGRLFRRLPARIDRGGKPGT
jgi:hypothetical protein